LPRPSRPRSYKSNPYHNATHAADVLQTLHVMMHRGGLVPGYVDPLTMMAAYVAAIVHDFEHLGLTNDFLINSADMLAIRCAALGCWAAGLLGCWAAGAGAGWWWC
jgi:hypothetical protein